MSEVLTQEDQGGDGTQRIEDEVGRKREGEGEAEAKKAFKDTITGSQAGGMGETRDGLQAEDEQQASREQQAMLALEQERALINDDDDFFFDEQTLNAVIHRQRKRDMQKE